MKAIEEITMQECTGCHACYSICPQKAIEMKPDERGFLQPVINQDLCIGCKLCQKVCPLNKEEEKTPQVEPVAYAAYSLDKDNQLNSSSGGIFSLLAAEILHQGGAVYGAAFTEGFRVEHLRVTENIRPLQTSKYVQSRIGDIFVQVEQDLRSKRQVLFSGTPCQVGGLYGYLQQRNMGKENLLTVDLICHGVPSPLLWEKHLETISKGRTPTFVNFRDKRLSWRRFSFTCQFDDGSEYSVEAGKDAYMQGFLGNLTLRECCYDCQFKKKCRPADITLADYWGIEKHDPDMANKDGTSAVLIHSRAGQNCFDKITAKVNWKSIPVDSVLAGNSTLVRSVPPHPRKELFWKQAIDRRYEYSDKLIAEVQAPTASEKINFWTARLKRAGRKIANRIFRK